MRRMSLLFSRPSLLSVASRRTLLRRLELTFCATMTEFVERKVCGTNELPINEMKEFNVEDGKVLLVNRENKIYALGTKCSHYGAPLVKGALYKNELRCPWHGACFNIETGDIEDFPGFARIPSYQVSVRGQEIWIKANLTELQKNSCQPTLLPKICESQVFIVVGSGAAGFECCNTLRNEGFQGRLIMITSDDVLPYDRTKLSKAPGTKAESLLIRPEDFYRQLHIEAKTDVTVSKLKHDVKEVLCSDGCSYGYNKIFLATGVNPRRFQVSGSELKNIFYLRTHKDGNEMAEVAKGKDIVVVGTSFIGMELASFLVGKANSVSIVGRSNVPFRHIFGQEIGARLKALYESKGVKFYLKSQVRSFVGKDYVQGVNIGTEVLKADAVFIGIGTQPDVSYLEGCPIAYAFYNNIVVKETMETSLPDVYAGGDLVAFPLSTFKKKLVSIGHWQIAQVHGKTAALNMLGKQVELNTVPFFWSAMFGKSLRVAGYTDVFDDLYIHGDLEQMEFAAYYFKNDAVVEVVTVAKDPVASMFAALLRDGQVLRKDDIRRDPTAWINRMKENYYPQAGHL